MDLSGFPRVRLANLPTPLERLPRLSEALGGPKIFVKRDDATGLALGGNKTRKLEYSLGQALSEGADTIVTAGGIQSNHVRQTAGACAKLGLDCDLILNRNVADVDAGYDQTGNIQLDRLLGARVQIHPANADRTALMEETAEKLRSAGKRPFIVPLGASDAIGALGYVNAALELVAQANAMELSLDYLVTATSSGGTFAGLAAGFAAIGYPVKVIGVDVDADVNALRDSVRPLAKAVLGKLGLESRLSAASMELLCGHAGAYYGQATADMREAVELTARTEGLILDPVYSGKAMAGLIGLIRAGRLGRDDTAVFLHSGGTPALFAYRSAFQ
jgi:L-cysteate sulfo-lyase